MKIVNIIKSSIAIRQRQGEKVRDRIIKKLAAGKRATVDCSGIACVSTHFFYPIAEIYTLYGEEHISKNVRFLHLNRFNKEVFDYCIKKNKKHAG